MTTQTKVRSTEEALKLAQEGVEIHAPNSPEYIVCAALIEALSSPTNGEAQPEQRSNEHLEPVAKYISETWCGSVVSLYDEIPLNTFLYTTPPQRDSSATPLTWVGLTDEEYLEAESVVWVTINLDSDEKEANREFYKAIEAKLRSKNT